MVKAKLGVLIGEEGVTSVTILGGDAQGRNEVLGLYAAIRNEIDAFDERVRERLAGRPTTGSGTGKREDLLLQPRDRGRG